MNYKYVSSSLALALVSQQSFAADPDFTGLTSALNFDSAAPMIIAAGVAVVGWTIGKGAIMSVIGMISGAARR